MMLSVMLAGLVAASPTALVAVHCSGVEEADAASMTKRVRADVARTGFQVKATKPCDDEACRQAALKAAEGLVFVDVGVLRAGPVAMVTVHLTQAGQPPATLERTADSHTLGQPGALVDEELRAALHKVLPPSPDDAPEEVEGDDDDIEHEGGDDASATATAAPAPESAEPVAAAEASPARVTRERGPEEGMLASVGLEPPLLAQLVLGTGFVLAAAAAATAVGGAGLAIYSYGVINDAGSLAAEKELAFGGMLLGAVGGAVGVPLLIGAVAVGAWGAVLAWE